MSYATYDSLPVPEAQRAHKANSSIQKVKSAEHRKELIATNKVCIIDNYADWCSPCKHIAPKFDELARKYQEKGFVFACEDIDDKHPDIPFLTGVPTFHVYYGGNLFKEIVGADASKLISAVESMKVLASE